MRIPTARGKDRETLPGPSAGATGCRMDFTRCRAASTGTPESLPGFRAGLAELLENCRDAGKAGSEFRRACRDRGKAKPDLRQACRNLGAGFTGSWERLPKASGSLPRVLEISRRFGKPLRVHGKACRRSGKV